MHRVPVLFVHSGRAQADVDKNDLLYTRAFPVSLEVDMVNKEVTGTLFGGYKNRAVYREGLGCALVVDASDAKLWAQAEAFPDRPDPPSDDVAWPAGNKADLAELPEGIDGRLIGEALDFAFADKPGKRLGARAVVIAHKGRIIGERYAPGYSSDMPLAL